MSIIAVVGPTATGKTRLGIALAQALAGEIVGADSRQVYRGMELGTAQPTADERAAAPHHLIGIISPRDSFGLVTYLDLAREAMSAIRSRGRIPVIVGGTGQYVWALLEEWTVPRVPPDLALRRDLESMAAEEGAGALHARLAAIDPEAAKAIHANNVRRVIRALEVYASTGLPITAQQARHPVHNALLIGLNMDRERLYAGIDHRVEEMYTRGLLDEIAALERAGFDGALPSMASIGYPEAWAVRAGELDVASAVLRTQQATHRLARQQHTWFRAADSRIQWLNAADDDVTGAAVWLARKWLAEHGPREARDAVHEDARDGQ